MCIIIQTRKTQGLSDSFENGKIAKSAAYYTR